MAHDRRAIRHAVIPAAGLGTRVQSLTGGGAKELLEIGGHPIIDYVIEEAIRGGCTRVGVVVRRGKEDLIEYLEGTWPNMTLLWQAQPRGLGDAILAAQPFVNDRPFAVLLPDDLVIGPVPATSQLMGCFKATGWSALGLVAPADSRHRMFSHCGRPALTPFDESKGWYQPSFSTGDRGPCAVIGRYAFTPEVFNVLAGVKKSAQGEFSEDGVLRYLASKNTLIACQLEGRCCTVGVPVGYRFATDLVADSSTGVKIRN